MTSDDQRQHRERDQRQPPVHHDQHDHDADQHEDVAEDRDDARGEQVVQHVDVGRHPRHQPADRDCDRRTGRRAAAGAGRSACRMSNMMRCPVICSIQVCRNSRANDAEQDREERQRDRDRARRDRRSAMCRSIATFISYGCASCSIDAGDDRRQRQRDLAPVRPQVAQQPPHQHARRRPCRGLLRRGQTCECRCQADAQLRRELLLKQLLAMELGVEAVRALTSSSWRALLDDPAVVEHDDDVGVPDGRDAVRDDDRRPVRA